MYHLPSSRASVLIFAINIAAPGRHVKRYRAAEEISDRSPMSEGKARALAGSTGGAAAAAGGYRGGPAAAGLKRTSRMITSRRYRTSMRAGLLGFRDRRRSAACATVRTAPGLSGQAEHTGSPSHAQRHLGAASCDTPHRPDVHIATC